MRRLTPELDGIPQTMLWTLYARASEARQPGGILRDPEALRIFDSLDFDFERHFGTPNRLFALRAALLDREVRQWLRKHPDGLVVSLGEGLETQALRVDNGRMRWLTVDLPEAIRVRESFLTPTERFHHQAISALDPQWMESVDASRGVFIIAQGLLMYLQPEAVEQLFVLLAERFPGAEMAFDIVPRSLSAATLAGLEQTPDYRLPAMPWGLNRQEIGPMLRRWSPHLSRLKFLPYRWSGRWPAPVEGFLDATLRRRSDRPSLVHLTL